MKHTLWSIVQLCWPLPIVPSRPAPAAQFVINPARSVGVVVLHVFVARIQNPLAIVVCRSVIAGSAGAAALRARRVKKNMVFIAVLGFGLQRRKS